MTSKKTIRNIIVILTVSLVVWLWAFITSPVSTRRGVETKTDYVESEVPERSDYDNFVRLDREKGNDFLTARISYAKIVNENFPFSSRNLNPTQTKLIIEVLSDTSSYKWGEFGTPDYDQTIFYYDSKDRIIAYTIIDMMGEIDNYPYRSLMKWGMMTDKGFSRLIKLINRK